jgi:hypothetical protein
MGCGGCAKKVLRGAAGLAKAGLQAAGVPVDAAPEDVVKARRDQCRACPHATRNDGPKYAASRGLTTLSRCQLCGCVIAAKTRMASERCPDGRW